MAGAGHQKDTNSRVSPIWGPWACVQVITRFSVTPALPLLMRSEDGSAECFRLILPFDLLKLRVATLTLEVRSETTKKVRETGEHLSNGPPATLCPGISLGPVRAPRGERRYSAADPTPGPTPHAPRKRRRSERGAGGLVRGAVL